MLQLLLGSLVPFGDPCEEPLICIAISQGKLTGLNSLAAAVTYFV
jgi:hypothetical protein